MRALFDSPSWIAISLLIVVAAILICLAALWAIRKHFSTKELKKSHDVVGFTFSIVGVLYSVILGFTVINAQDQYNIMLQTIHTEAILLADLYEDAAYFSQEECARIRGTLQEYIDHVIRDEWWAKQEKTINVHSRTIIKNIWDSYYYIELTDEKVKIWYTESIGKLNRFMNARLARQFNSWVHLGPMMWTLLIVGAVIVTGFMFFFGLENMRSHMLLTGLLAGYLAFMLYLVYTLDNAFRGPLGLKPTALVQVSQLFEEWDNEEKGI
jgi:ABC-type multidrug transport system fused ATPase/permease subunit